MKPAYAQRMSRLTASEIRELLKIAERPGMISFAGGLPAPELFPIQELMKMCRHVLKHDGAHALQYATTEGFLPLRTWIARRMNATLGTHVAADNILITNGSQQAIDLTGKVFIDEGDVILCESPTYLAAITAFKAYGCRFIEVPTDDDGMQMPELEAILERTERVKAIYVIPNFQNPTGRTMACARRKRLTELAIQHNVMVLEDNPYGELRFEGEVLPSVQSFDTEGRVLCTGTFSKILCPGLRVGWIAGDTEIIRKYVLVKQGVDLQSNTFAQALITAYLERYDIQEHINTILAAYKKRRDIMLTEMDRLFPDEVRFTRPAGGLFTWVTLPGSVNTRALLKDCIKRNVAFVPGGSFFPNGGNEATMRLNFSNMQEYSIGQGMRVIASALCKHMEKKHIAPM